jgi:hypothetical protein
MIETHATPRTRRAPRPRSTASEAPPTADLTRQISVMRGALEARRRENDRLRRSCARLEAENRRLAGKPDQRPPATDRRTAMREALLDPCSLNP